MFQQNIKYYVVNKILCWATLAGLNFKQRLKYQATENISHI